ncbi:MAG TPA: M12 family metallo-peptidase [Thermoanaerobaculia bacterium]|nr:M12 family metallo-peptidase [Thermoanaerobaculia bacterium]
MTSLRRMGGRVAVSAALALASLVFSAPARGTSAEANLPRAADPGQIVDLPGDRGLAELFSFDGRLASALLTLAPEEGREVIEFPTTPGVRRRVRLVRHEIYADGARVYRVEGQVRTEVPRSRLVFFWGSDLEGAGNRLFVALDPATRGFSGLVHGPEGTHEIARDPTDRRERHVLARPRVPDGAAWRCGQEDFVETAVSWAPPANRRAEALSRRSNALSSLHSGIVAIDTDNEYMTYWGNNTTNATNYIAQLIASINVMYERDLNLRLLQGTTFLRTTADPYAQGPGSGQNANIAELNEFTSYWNAHYPNATYPRSVATMLSGKQPGNFSASGIAWLAGSVCGDSSDYSFCQVFKTSYLAGDTLVVGHEIGHNLGSPHTHCYAAPAPDHCYNFESCYTGPTSCPAPLMINGYNATGTLMSYCHVSPCNSGTTYAFHPSTISRYVGDTLDAGASSGCLAVVGGGGPQAPPPVSAATLLHPLTPCRVLDTRNAVGPLGGPAIGGGGQRTFIVSNSCGVPPGAVAVSANATIVNPAAQGDLIVYPAGISAPTASTISFRAGRTRANNVQIYLALDGSIVARNNSGGALDFVVDVNGYYQ